MALFILNYVKSEERGKDGKMPVSRHKPLTTPVTEKQSTALSLLKLSAKPKSPESNAGYKALR